MRSQFRKKKLEVIRTTDSGGKGYVTNNMNIDGYPVIEMLNGDVIYQEGSLTTNTNLLTKGVEVQIRSGSCIAPT